VSDVFQPCVRDAGASGINVDGLPPLPDFDLIEQQTATLRRAGTTISTSINAAAGKWRGLSSVYEAPEAPIVLSGFGPVLAHAGQLETALSAAIACLNDYAVRSRELKAKVEALRGRVNGLDDLIGGNDDWQGHLSIVDQRRDLFNDTSALAQEILASDATCATGLNAIYGAGAITATSIPVSDLNGSTDPISNFFTNALHLYGSDEEMPDQPWGPATVSVRLGGPWSFAQGLTSSVLGTLGATHTLLATTDKVKQAQAWQGMATLAGAGLTTAAVVNRGFKDASKTEIDAVLTVAGAAKSVVHYDEWGRDPAYASGAASFDVASLFVPGGAGVGAKAGGLAGHAGVAGARTGRLLEEAGTAGRWAGKLGELPAKTQAALNGVSVRAWENTVRPALDNLAGALNRVDDGTATVRIADGVAAGGHGPFAGAADRLYSIVDRVDHSLQAGNKASPLEAALEPPAGATSRGTVHGPIVDHSGGLRELPGRAPEHQPVIGETDGGSDKLWHNDLGGAPRPAENAPARHRAEGPVDSATPVVQDSAAAPRGAGDGVAAADPTNAPPGHVANNGADSGAVPSDQQIADTPTDPALADHSEATSPPFDQDPDGSSGRAALSDVLPKGQPSAAAQALGRIPGWKLDGMEVLATETKQISASGEIIPTKSLPHPQIDLLAAEYPKQAKLDGLPASDPLVQRQLPDGFQRWNGATMDDYAGKYTDGTYPDGAPKIRDDAWPDPTRHPDGFLTPESRTPVVLKPGYRMDRYGSESGRFTAPQGSMFPDRALPDYSLDAGYHIYEVLHDLPAWAGPTAPAFGKKGGGGQLFMQYRIRDLLQKGFLREVR
jgi:hypothetical protein